jgi:hypothetical protein
MMDRPVIRILENANGERISPVDMDLQRDEADIQGLSSSPLPAS